MSVPAIFYLSALLSVALVVAAGPIVREPCDMIELNHVHNDLGELLFSQVVLWEWDREESMYRVRNWRIFEGRTRPTLDYRSKLYVSRWDDFGTQRSVRGEHFIESWTQYDREREDRQSLPVSYRKLLIQGAIK